MKTSASGFSLVECVLALSITGTLLVAVMGLLPAGLQATVSASQKESESLIVDHIRQQSETIPVFGDSYFDASGLPVDRQSLSKAFAVRIEKSAATVLPGDDAPVMRSMRVTISNRVIGDPFGDPRHLRVRHLALAPLPKGTSP